MKKSKFISLFVVLVVAFSFTLTACNGNNHNIIYGSWQVSKAATCTYVGEETRICINDDTLTQSRPVPALGHDYGEWVEITPATETEKGLKRAYCKHDASHYIDDEIPLLIPTVGTEPPVEEEEEPPVVLTPPVIPADGPGIFVLAGYSKFITEAKIYAIVKDFEIYCNENAVPRAFIGWRMYASTLNVAPLCTAIKTDADVDILLGGGANLNTTGALGANALSSANVTIYFDGSANDGTRRHARINDETLTMAFWTYISSPRAVAILTAVL